MSESTGFLNNLCSGIRKRLNGNKKSKYREVNLGWARQKYLKHLSPGKIYSHQLFHCETKFYDGPEYFHGLKEIFIDEVYKQELPHNPLILDCGSHIGLSIIYLKKSFPSAKIIGFEPDQRNFALLQQNIAQHKLDKVELVNKAVWITNGPINFRSEGNMGSKIEKGNSDAQMIDAVRLKDYLNQKIDFLKMDIEGAEYEVLKDIASHLPFIENLFIEYHGSFTQQGELLEILDLLNRSGFNFYIKEASNVYEHPFLYRKMQDQRYYDIQLNIFCVRVPEA